MSQYVLEVFYNKGLIGHMYVVIKNLVTGTAQRIELVDQDAALIRSGLSHSMGFFQYISHKFVQAAGYARRQVLFEEVSFGSTLNQVESEFLGAFRLDQFQYDSLLAYIKEQLSGNYGYLNFSENIQNCGSFIVGMLNAIKVQFPALGWLHNLIQLPFAIKQSLPLIAASLFVMGKSIYGDNGRYCQLIEDDSYCYPLKPYYG